MSEDAARRIATHLGRRGLAAPARLILDAHRPLAPMLADIGAALAPMMGWRDAAASGSLRQLMGDESAVDRVLHELDALGERDAEPR
ncbi:MAG: hypothetical protein ABIO99_03955 [Candidatus Limnocylindria bacterium]